MHQRNRHQPHAREQEPVEHHVLHAHLVHRNAAEEKPRAPQAPRRSACAIAQPLRASAGACRLAHLSLMSHTPSIPLSLVPQSLCPSPPHSPLRLTTVHPLGENRTNGEAASSSGLLGSGGPGAGTF